MTLANLQRILPAPANRTETTGHESWPDLEQRLGTALPADYKAFIDVYGSGTINEFLWIHSPFTENPYVNLERRHVRAGEILAELATGEEKIPFSYFPVPGGLFAFGSTDNGDVLYWKTSGNPDSWTVVVNESRGPLWESYDMSMTEFLLRLLTGQLVCAVFPDDFRDDTPNFITEDDA